MDAVANRGDVDAQHFDYGAPTLGAYVALSEAARDPRVRAVAAESPYNHPSEMAGLLSNRMGLGVVFRSLPAWLRSDSAG